MVFDARPWEPYHVEQRRSKAEIACDLEQFLRKSAAQREKIKGRRILVTEGRKSCP